MSTNLINLHMLFNLLQVFDCKENNILNWESFIQWHICNYIADKYYRYNDGKKKRWWNLM